MATSNTPPKPEDYGLTSDRVEWLSKHIPELESWEQEYKKTHVAGVAVGGVVDAAESIFNLALPKEKEIEISDWVDEPKTIVGKFIRPASQFFVPYGGAYNIAAKGFLFIKLSLDLH